VHGKQLPWFVTPLLHTLLTDDELSIISLTLHLSGSILSNLHAAPPKTHNPTSQHTHGPNHSIRVKNSVCTAILQVQSSYRASSCPGSCPTASIMTCTTSSPPAAAAAAATARRQQWQQWRLAGSSMCRVADGCSRPTPFGPPPILSGGCSRYVAPSHTVTCDMWHVFCLVGLWLFRCDQMVAMCLAQH
jgi:hypothetical protein